MIYTIELKGSLFGIIPYTKKIKNIKFHAFPTDFNNQSFLMIVKIDESREMINMDKYKRVIFPNLAFVNINQDQNQGQQKETTDLDNMTDNQKTLLNQI